MSPDGNGARGEQRSGRAIEVRDLEKSFAIPLEQHTTVKERVLQPRTWFGAEMRSLPALQGISFDVGRGEFFGVVGRNGCGKSTLLKLLASIYAHDRGSIRVAGRLAPFIELGVGFNPELSAHDNVVLNGVMMGLTPTEARSRFDAVIEYAELEEYTEMKLKNYSSGMYVRLAFSLMLQVDADILLVDEVLAVGDAGFQSKCQQSLREMQEHGTTVLLVSHSMDVIEKNCDRAMLIEDGKIELIGDPSQVADRYMEILLPEEEEEEEVEEEPVVEEPTGASVTDLWLNGPDGVRGDAVASDERITVNLGIRADIDIRHPLLLLELIKHPEGVRISAIRLDDGNPIGTICEGDEVTVQVGIENRLGPGDYLVSYALGHWVGGDVQLLERCTEPAPLTVIGSGDEDVVIALEHDVTVDRGVPEKRQ